ncbi:MAG: hypothetical protein Q8M11_15375 [Sulfuritalea sp.]|jgi:hypothetical protein|nr:hypothetical protein [Sulfuritalea sp.]MDP1983115.1 hypothetical protein [Sulfuritalea sp.]
MPYDVLRRAAGGARRIAATLSRRALPGLLAASLGSCAAFAADVVVHPPAPLPVRIAIATAVEVEPVLARRFKHAGFEQEGASRDARAVAHWVVDSGDSQGMPFAIVDKKDAKVFIFDADGRLRGAAPALLGLAIGDDAVPDIGNRALSSILPAERTTPAGRFVASLDLNLKGKQILWVDYAGAVSMHPVVSANPAERRLQRMATPTPLDNRISYGCINVPAKFFDWVVRPAFTGTSGIVYVLPETRSAQTLFGFYEVSAPSGKGGL